MDTEPITLILFIIISLLSISSTASALELFFSDRQKKIIINKIDEFTLKLDANKKSFDFFWEKTHSEWTNHKSFYFYIYHIFVFLLGYFLISLCCPKSDLKIFMTIWLANSVAEDILRKYWRHRYKVFEKPYSFIKHFKRLILVSLQMPLVISNAKILTFLFNFFYKGISFPETSFNKLYFWFDFFENGKIAPEYEYFSIMLITATFLQIIVFGVLFLYSVVILTFPIHFLSSILHFFSWVFWRITSFPDGYFKAIALFISTIIFPIVTFLIFRYKYF